jgi:hypothetical protein
MVSAVTRAPRLYAAARCILSSGAAVLTDKQAARLLELFANDNHVRVEATWAI